MRADMAPSAAGARSWPCEFRTIVGQVCLIRAGARSHRVATPCDKEGPHSRTGIERKHHRQVGTLSFPTYAGLSNTR